jgi:CheY-like chemotaxis protein
VRELLFNVVKHAEVKEAQISLHRRNNHIELSVQDGGAGFDPTVVARRKRQGGGFGLPTIRERLELLGGSMEIDSKPGQGSRFTLRTPHRLAAPVPSAASAVLPGAAARRTDSPAPLARTAGCSVERKIRILLADDHVMVRQGLLRLLREEPDMEVVGEAADGKTAVEMVRRLLPDVVTMDINLPKLDGIEATRLIRDKFPGVKVIGLSMFEETHRAQAMREAGAATYLTKSGATADLLAAIRACVAPGRAPRKSPPDGSEKKPE